MSDCIRVVLPQQAGSDPIRAPGVVSVWWMPVTGLEEFVLPHWARVLDAEERARALRFVRIADRRAFIAAHLLRRAALQQATGMRATVFRFVAGAYGKPALHPSHDLPRIAFNLSHTGGAVACALALDHALGIDIEDEQRRNATTEIAHAFFAPAENAWLRMVDPEARPAAFFTLWTLKEAFIKALGTGLSHPLDTFAFQPGPDGIHFDPPPNEHAGDWEFHHAVPDRRHHLAVAIRNGRGQAPLRLAVRAVTLPMLGAWLEYAEEAGPG